MDFAIASTPTGTPPPVTTGGYSRPRPSRRRRRDSPLNVHSKQASAPVRNGLLFGDEKGQFRQPRFHQSLPNKSRSGSRTSLSTRSISSGSGCISDLAPHRTADPIASCSEAAVEATSFGSLLAALGASSSAGDVAAYMARAPTKAVQKSKRPAGQSRTNSGASIRTVDSTAANRAQLKANFNDVYFPKEFVTAFCPTRFLLYHSKLTSKVQLAEQALYLTQLGASTGDGQVINEALRLYQAAILQLRGQLSRPNAACDDQVFVIAHLLSLCELYTAVSLDDTKRRHHMNGIGKLLEARGPGSIRTLPQKITLQIYQQSALWDALLSRKAGATCHPEWISLLASGSACKWKLPEMTSFVMQVPALLEKVDRLRSPSHEPHTTEILDALSELKAFERDLREWMNYWYEEVDASPYRHVPTVDCNWLVGPLIGEDLVYVFPSAFEFPGTAHAKAHEQFWMALLALLEASKDLASLEPFSSSSGEVPFCETTTHYAQTQRAQAEITECADSLCMTAMYMCQPRNGVDGYIDACHCIQFAARWYRKSARFEKLAWCEQALKGIGRFGIRAPTI